MNPDADDLYEFIGASPVDSQAEISKQLAQVRAKKLDDDAWDNKKIFEAESKLDDPESRRKYNEKHGYPTDWDGDRDTVELELLAPGETIEVNETATFRVRNADGDPVSGVNIVVGGKDVGPTDENGAISMEFGSPDDVRVWTETDGDSETWFIDDSVSVEVVKERRVLSITAAGSEVLVGENVTFTVTDDTGNAVADATVNTGSESGTTDADGKCTLEFPDAGTVDVEATKPGDSTTSYEPDTVTFDVVKEQRSLRVSPLTTDIEADSPVTFVVEDETGSPVEGATVETPAGTETTDPSGECTLEFPAAGTVDIDVRKPDTPSVEFEANSTTVEVATRDRHLEIVPAENPVDVEEPVTFTVHDSSGVPVEGATVETSDGTATTDGSGECSITFSTAGSFDVEAHKTDSSTTTFHSASTGLEVTKVERDLVIVLDGPVEVREPVPVRVVDTEGNPVSDTTVETPSGKKTTGSDGTCTVEFSDVGTVTVEARKPDDATTTYESATESVDARPETRPLSVSASPNPSEYGDLVEFTVRDESGPVEGAIVEVDDRSAKTGTEGTCTIVLSSLGEIAVTATRTDEETITYVDGSTTVTIERKELSLGVSVDSQEVTVGEPVTVTVTDENGAPLEGAIVQLPAGSEVTGESGQCTVAFEAPARAQVRASKRGDAIIYTPARETVRVTAAPGETPKAESSDPAPPVSRIGVPETGIPMLVGLVVSAVVAGAIVGTSGELTTGILAGLFALVAGVVGSFIVLNPPSRAT